eukprot:TRINITY_DN20669_c0_g3_i1.p1 TRINITY_DN20669_c0_g3~~TRINITY_DN20669_c0_g3_i1.p1  ORF type:complete len:843 (+),score=118.62 TRINITY_DN20669_c0_g3_i1:299-2827(+)
MYSEVSTRPLHRGDLWTGMESAFRGKRLGNHHLVDHAQQVFDEASFSSKPIAVAEIASADLAQKRGCWNLFLSEPKFGEALYADVDGPQHDATLVRRPAMLNIRVGRLHDDLPGRHVAGCGRVRPRDASNGSSPSSSPSARRPRVMIMTRGTRGDVQPCLALAHGLIRERQCEVTLVTELHWKKFVQDSREGLPPGSLHFRPCGGDTMQQTQAPIAVRILQLGQKYDVLQAAVLSKSESNFFSSEGAFMYWAREEEPDFIVFAFTVTHIAMIISEVLQIPIVGFFLQPAQKIEQRPDPRTLRDVIAKTARDVVSSREFVAILTHLMQMIPDGGVTLNGLRMSRGLLPFPPGITDKFLQSEELRHQGIPQIVPINPTLLGTAGDEIACSGVTLTDFIFLRTEGDNELPSGISRFLRETKQQKVVAMTFSSMPIGEVKILSAAVDLCENCCASNTPSSASGGERRTSRTSSGSGDVALIVTIGGQRHSPVLPNSELEDKVIELTSQNRLLVLGDPRDERLWVTKQGVNFGALFPKMDALIIHGGLGVTAEALAAGKPTVVGGILLLDQRFWAARVKELGIGPEAIYVDNMLDPDETATNQQTRITGIMREALFDSTWQDNATELRTRILSADDPDGVKINVEAVYQAGTNPEYKRFVNDAYSEYRGCPQCALRQLNCCLRCVQCFVARCAGGIVYQVPHLLIMQLRCLICLFSKVLRVVFFAGCAVLFGGIGLVLAFWIAGLVMPRLISNPEAPTWAALVLWIPFVGLEALALQFLRRACATHSAPDDLDDERQMSHYSSAARASRPTVSGAFYSQGRPTSMSERSRSARLLSSEPADAGHGEP